MIPAVTIRNHRAVHKCVPPSGSVHGRKTRLQGWQECSLLNYQRRLHPTLSDILHPYFPWCDLPASLIQLRKSSNLPKKITPNWENPASTDNWNSKLQPLLVGFWFLKKKKFKVFSSRCVLRAKSFLMSFILQQSYLMLICPLPLEQ